MAVPTSGNHDCLRLDAATYDIRSAGSQLAAAIIRGLFGIHRWYVPGACHIAEIASSILRSVRLDAQSRMTRKIRSE
jgi:hypothetical protein